MIITKQSNIYYKDYEKYGFIMSDYWVCSDTIDGNENKRINALVDALKKNGHKAHNGGVGPNTIQSHGMTSGAKGQIGVFICGGVDIQVFWDFVQGIGSYYHYKRFIYVYASDTATSDKWLTCNGAKTWKTTIAHDDNYSGGRGDAIGKTVDKYCKEHKDKIWYACGKLGCNFDEVIQNFISGEGAGDGSGESSSSSGSSKKKEATGSTIKEALQKLLKHWDGEVECYIRGDEVYVHKVREPKTYTSLLLQEGVNVLSGSITVKDYNPDTINSLTVKWTEGIIGFKDPVLVKRFGEQDIVVDAVRVESVKSLEYAQAQAEAEAEVSEGIATARVDKNVGGSSKKVQQSTSTGDDKKKNTNNTNNANDDGDEDESNTTSKKKKQKTKTTKIDNYDEALEFAYLQWNRIRRDNGHSIDCQVIGSKEWKVGEWCRVILPSFEEDSYMYVTRVSHSGDTDWTCNLTLKDYPPGWGVEEDDEDSSK